MFQLPITRRHLLQAGACAAISPALGTAILPAHAQTPAGEPVWRHALSLFGDIKYPADFKRFDYVNPAAPKGGVARMISLGTFDNFNIAVAGVKGSIAAPAGAIYETLMSKSLDEIVTEYGLLAESAAHPDDFAWVTYRLRKEARWHDGQPVKPADVIFSMEALKKNSPMYASYYRHVVKFEQVGERDIKFTFDSPGNRELPSIVGELPVLPKHWWEGTDSQGRKRDVSATTLEPPLGSGPYRIKDFVPGRSVTMERVKDYWGANLPTQVGLNNFDEMRYEYFRDNTVALEAFKADQADWISENSAKQWATAIRLSGRGRKARGQGRVSGQRFRADAGLHSQPAPRPVQGCAAAPGLQLRLRFRGDEQAAVLRTVSAHRQLFLRDRTGVVGIAARAGVADPRDGARQGAGRGVHDALQEPGRRQSGSRSRQSARGRAPAEGSRLRGGRSQAGRSQPASLLRSRFWFRIRPRSGSRCSTSHRSSASVSRLQSAPSTTRNTRTGCAASTST